MEVALLLPHKHRSGLALEVHVGLAADVDGDELDRAAGEEPGPLAGVVVGDRRRAAPDGQRTAADAESAGLGLDAPLAHLRLTVIEVKDARRDPGRVFAVPLEGGREDQVLALWQVLAGDNPLHEAAEEDIDVVEAVVVDVE